MPHQCVKNKLIHSRLHKVQWQLFKQVWDHRADGQISEITSARSASQAAQTARVPLGGLSGTPKSAMAASTALCTLYQVR